MSEQQKLIQYLVRNPVPNPIGFETWLIAASEQALGMDRQAAELVAARRKQRLWTEFAKFDQQLRRRGCLSVFETVDERSKIFRSPSMPLDERSLTRKLLYRDRHHVVSWIDNLGDRKFEFLGAATAHFLGAHRSIVTSGGNDGGVDFYALLPSWGSSGVFHSPQKYVRVVGQSKFYSAPAGVDPAKLLEKTVDDIRSLTVEMAHRIPDWFRSERGPVVGVMLAPFGFQSGAVARSHNSGIMLADSIDVAETIISSRLYKRRRAEGASPSEILEEGICAVGWSL